MDFSKLVKLKATAHRVPATMTLREVGAWVFDLYADPEEIHAADIDMAIIGLTMDGSDEGIPTAEEMRLMKFGSDGSRRLILCDVALACPTTQRPYWQWGEDYPPWVIGSHDGRYVANIMSDAWRDILMSEIEHVKAAGFDGIWLDCRYPVPLDSEMADLIGKVRVRLGHDKTLICANAEHLIELPGFEDEIDGWGRVGLYSGGEKPDDDAIEQLHKANKPVFVVELSEHDDEKIADYRRLVSEQGFNPCVVTEEGWG